MPRLRFHSLPAAWAAILAVWCGLVAAAAAVRWLQGWPDYAPQEPQRTQLRDLLLLHGTLAVLLAVVGVGLHRKRTQWPGWLRLLAAGTPVLLLVSADRISDYAVPRLAEPPDVVTWDRRLGWRLRPNAEGYWGSPITINTRGLRGPEVAEQKNADELRLLFVGDSITFGYGVAYADSYVARVEEILDRELANRRVRGVSLAVVGYSTWQQRILLETKGLDFRPDLVVIAFCLNDVTEKYTLARYGGNMHDAETEALGRHLRRSGLFRLGTMGFAHLRQARSLEAGEPMSGLGVMDLFLRPATPRVERAWQETEEELRGMERLCRSNGIPLAMVCFPYDFQLLSNNPPPHPQSRLAAWSAAHSVPFLDLRPALTRAADTAAVTGRRVMMDACHPTALGHAAAAREIAAFLVTERLLPAASPDPAEDAPPEDEAPPPWTAAASTR